MIYTILILGLMVPGWLLYLPLFLLIAYKMFQKDGRFLFLLGVGIIVTFLHIINGSGDLKLLMPFILLGALFSRERAKDSRRRLQIIFYSWSFISIVFGFLYSFHFIAADNVLVQQYWTQDADIFNYRLEYINTFRMGSFYFNPNQYSYIALIFLLALAAIRGTNWYIFTIYILLLVMTQSRMFLLIAVAFYPIFTKHSAKRVAILLFAIGLIYMVVADSGLGESRLFALKDSYLGHALYKFEFLVELFNRSSIEQLTGSGNAVKVVGYDADIGFVIQYYGWPIGVSLIFLYSLFLYRRMSFILAALCLCASLYGTVLVNTRVALVMAVLFTVSNQYLRTTRRVGQGG